MRMSIVVDFWDLWYLSSVIDLCGESMLEYTLLKNIKYTFTFYSIYLQFTCCILDLV